MKICRPEEGDDHYLDTQWTYLIKAFGLEVVLFHQLGRKQVVLVQPKTGRYVQGETSLENYNHPHTCIYLFGSSHRSWTSEELSGLNIVDRLYIPVQGDWDFFSPQAAAIVAWDRRIRYG